MRLIYNAASCYIWAQAGPREQLARNSSIGVLIVLLAWPDTSLLTCLFQGFPAVGYVHPCGVWPPQAKSWQELGDALSQSSSEQQAAIDALKPGPDDETIYEAGNKDEVAGYCTPAMTLAQLKAATSRYRLIRRFVITQATGKKRVIDDAASSGQSELTSDANKLRFTTAVQPCYHLKALMKACTDQQRPISSYGDHLTTAGEDLPDAYRKMPLQPEHSWACIVAYWDCQANALRFQRYHSLLFGLPAAFNRLPFLLQAACRRLLATLATMYFDDLTVQDWARAAAGSQQAIEDLADAMGYPFAEAKRQRPSTQGGFLGLIHDLAACRTAAEIRMWIRDRLETKVRGYITDSLTTAKLAPGAAAKLYGGFTFLDQGMFGKVSRAGLS